MKTVVVGISFVRATGGAQCRPEDNLKASELRSRSTKCVCWSVIILIEDNYESLTVHSLLTVVFPVCLKLRPLLTTHWILVYMFGLFSFQIVVSIVLTLEYLLLAFSSHINLIT